jgi:branched-subunit amino acid transport protein AzlD
MPSTQTSLAIIAVVALVTLFIRALPFLLFRDSGKLPNFITYLGSVLPFAIIAMLVVYCLKSVSVFAYPYGIPEFLSVAVVVLLQRWKHNTLLSVGGGTVFYMVLIQLVFR